MTTNSHNPVDGEVQALIEWLKPQISELENICDELPFGLDEDDAMQLKVMRFALNALNTTAQPVSDGWVTVPRSLTAENGAKAALFGEFSVQQNITCHECFGEGCDDCNGQGNWTENVLVDWTTIKEIWAKGVEHFLAAAPGGQ